MTSLESPSDGGHKRKGRTTTWKGSRLAAMAMAIIGLLHGTVQTPLLLMVTIATIAVMMIAAAALFASGDWHERTRWRSWLTLILAADAGLCVGWGVGVLVFVFYHGQGGPYFYMYFPLIP